MAHMAFHVGLANGKHKLLEEYDAHRRDYELGVSQNSYTILVPAVKV